MDSSYVLAKVAVTEAEAAPRIDPAAAATQDWRNDRVRLLQAIDAQLDAATDDAARADILDRLTMSLRTAAQA
jgi:hypothetical protein